MKILLCVLALMPAFAQTAPPADAPVLPFLLPAVAEAPAPLTAGWLAEPAGQTEQNRPPANAAGQSRNQSVLKPKPGQLVIKPKDYHDASGYFHPFTRMPRFV